MNTIYNIKNTMVAALLTNASEATKVTGARFASFTYTNEAGEKSRYNVIMGVNIESLYKSDLRTLKTLRNTLTGVKLTACDELIASITESLTKGIGNNSAYTLKGYYTPISQNGEIKLHEDETGNQFLYVRGYVVKKTKLIEGTYKTVKSSEKTLAKKEIEKSLKRGKIRTFKINTNDLHSIKVNGLTLELN